MASQDAGPWTHGLGPSMAGDLGTGWAQGFGVVMAYGFGTGMVQGLGLRLESHGRS